MIYKRKDKRTKKILHLLVMILGIGFIYLGWSQLHWTWNLLILPLGLLIAVSGYKNFKGTAFEIEELAFSSDGVKITFLNGEQKEIKNENFNYALLVKKSYRPIKAIEFIEKKKIGLFRGKSIGKIGVGKWKESIEDIAVHLIKDNFERKTWAFDWSLGDFLMIFTFLLLGATESIAEDYVEEVRGGITTPQAKAEIEGAIIDAKMNAIERTLKAEENFFKRKGLKK